MSTGSCHLASSPQGFPPLPLSAGHPAFCHAPALFCPQDPDNTIFGGLSRSVCEQAEYLARLVCDSNYLLLALKYLNQDCDTLLRLPDSVSAHASKHKHRAPVPRPTPLISCQRFRAQRPNGLSHFLINVL